MFSSANTEVKLKFRRTIVDFQEKFVFWSKEKKSF